MRYILKWNPELAKNLWTEFSPQRLVAMPAIIGLITPVLVWATTPVRVKGRAARPVEVPAELIPTFNAAAVARMVQPAGPFVLLDLYGPEHL